MNETSLQPYCRETSKPPSLKRLEFFQILSETFPFLGLLLFSLHLTALFLSLTLFGMLLSSTLKQFVSKMLFCVKKGKDWQILTELGSIINILLHYGSLLHMPGIKHFQSSFASAQGLPTKTHLYLYATCVNVISFLKETIEIWCLWRGISFLSFPSFFLPLFFSSLQMKPETPAAIDRMMAGSLAKSWLGSPYEGH